MERHKAHKPGAIARNATPHISGSHKFWLVLLLSAVAAVSLPQPAGAQFVDAFDRPDAAALGNGWVEKTPAAFSLAGEAAEKQALGGGYRDFLVYRPAAENLLDVEASVEFQLTNAQPGYPQVFTRVQTGISAFADFLDGYMLYIDDNASRAVLGRQLGTDFVTALATINLSPALNTIDTFRLRLRSTGTNPVALTAFVERRNGANWDVIGQAAVNDSAVDRIAVAGSVGFSGYIEASYNYDNFTRTDLGSGSNPLPQLTSLNPSNVTEGGPDFTLSALGSDFIAGSVIRWNGADRITTFVSANELQTTITAADIATDGTADVTVFTPGPGGGTSVAQILTIDPAGGSNPLPALTMLAPNSATEGGSAFTLSAQGSGFVAGSVVRWNGADRATTFVSANELQAAITAADIATDGTANVTVFTPAPGGGTSIAQTFTIDPAGGSNPLPALTTINPNNATEGDSAFTLSAQGSGFVAGSVVRWNGADRATTFVSANELQATITAADIATDGTANVTVFTPAPGGGSSAAQTFTIDPIGGGPATPVVTSTFPEAVSAGSAPFALTIVGSNFTAQSVVNWNGSSRPTTFVSPQELEAQLNGTDVAAAGVNTVTVSTSGNTSEPYPFFALEQGSTYFFDNFNSADSGSIGNDWTEKSPGAFSLQNGEVVGVETPFAYYRDNIVYRPLSEDRRDVELSMEFVRQDSLGFAQLHARAQRSTLTVPDTLQSYILFIDDYVPGFGALEFAIGPVTTGFNECTIRMMPLTEPLQIGERYRLTFRVTGGNPVELEGELDRYDGSEWQPFFSGTVTHDDNTLPDPWYCFPGSMPPPISTAGAIGFSKWTDSPENYDNFYWLDLTGLADEPLIASLSPETIEVGEPAFSVVVGGSNFTPNSVTRWDGQDRPTTFISSTALRMDLSAADAATIRSVPITVFTPAPGGGLSNVATFQVIAVGQQPNPQPTLTSVVPSSIPQGSVATQVNIAGGGFVPGSILRWNGLDLATTFVSDSSITAVVPANLLSAAGSGALTVFNPLPAGGTSSPLTLSVTVANELFDDFNRLDAAAPGAGWIEKSPVSYQIADNELMKIGASVGYRDNVVQRPATEETQNVEASTEIRFTNAQPGYPQLYTRLQTATIAQTNVLDGYVLYIDNNPSRAVLGRQNGSQFVTALATIDMSEPLNTNATYRLRMSTTGTSPVTITADIAILEADGYRTIGQAAVADSSVNRIQNSGVSGLGGDSEQSYVYDNFRSRSLN